MLSKPKKEGGMGFRDIRCFNLTMLAKQGWRLLQDTESLLYRYFKVRYFPRSNSLEATDVPNSSYVWKSLMAAQPILKKGCCWRVGDGSNIRVIQDRWIPNYPTNKVLHMPLEVDGEWRVSELIDWTVLDWDRGVLAANFHREDMEAIIRIHLSRRQVPDLIMWLPNKKGIYMVKSRYHMARLLSQEVDGLEGSSGRNDRD